MDRPGLLATPAGLWDEADIANLLRTRPSLEVVLALRHVETIRGALRIRNAELAGLRRLSIIRGAERRLEELGGTEPLWGGPKLIAIGHTLEPGEQ